MDLDKEDGVSGCGRWGRGWEKKKMTDRASLDRLHQGGGYFDLGVGVCSEGTTCRMEDGIRNRRREAWEDELCHL